MNKILLIGFGRSNRAVKKYFEKTSDITIIDDDEHREEAAKVKSQLLLFDIAFVSPGIRPENELYRLGHLLSDKLTNELAFAFLLVPSQVKTILVTGSNGKTTTVLLLAYLLRRAGKKVIVAGNIGNPLLTSLSQLSAVDYLIVEVSSFQAELWPVSHPADYLIYTSLAPNHLDKYPDFPTYKAAKKRLALGARTVITTYEVKKEMYLKNVELTAIENDFHEKYIEAFGRHNLTDLRLAEKVLDLEGIEVGDNAEALYRFAFPHFRQEEIAEKDGVVIVNDSKSTSAAATLAALERYRDYRKIVILGGTIKSDLRLLVDYPETT